MLVGIENAKNLARQICFSPVFTLNTPLSKASCRNYPFMLTVVPSIPRALSRQRDEIMRQTWNLDSGINHYGSASAAGPHSNTKPVQPSQLHDAGTGLEYNPCENSTCPKH